MTPSDLRYQASREWLEAEILAGRPASHRRHSLVVDLESLDPRQAKRVEAILDGIVFKPDLGRVIVLDSGIDPERRYGASDDELAAMDDPVVRAVGALPEIASPTRDLESVLTATEEWLAQYCTAALDAIEQLNQTRPDGKNPFGKKISWTAVRIPFGPDSEATVRPDDGPNAMRDARAAWAWRWAAKDRFSAQSVEAATEATAPSPEESHAWIETEGPEEIAQRFLSWAKRRYMAAKAHDRARRAQVPDFDTEMARWASENGSDRLQLGIEDGYRMNSRYLAERLAAEAPGFFAMPANSVKDGWARQTGSPSEEALRLRRRVQAAMDKCAPVNFDGKPSAEIVTVTEPPPQIYFAHEEGDPFSGTEVTDLPSKEAWPWFRNDDGGVFGYNAKPFEAVVVKNWLGRFHLIGAVSGENGSRPVGLWAIPDRQHFHEDGAVDAQDPDAKAPVAAKRKPPRPGGDDDIPF